MKQTATFITCLFFCLTAMAQKPNDGRGEGMPPQDRKEFSPKAYNKAMEDFILKETCITAQEGEKLFPMLHEMHEKQRKIKDQDRELFKNFWQKEPTESEMENAINKSLALDVENAKIEQSYYKKFHTVISWKKIGQLRMALFRFQFHALHQFTPNRKGNGNRGGHDNQKKQ